MTGQTPHVNDAPVVVFSRAGCHLCSYAEDVIARVADELGFTWVSVDVDEDPLLVERFGEFVPVTYVGGAKHDFWLLDEGKFREAIATIL